MNIIIQSDILSTHEGRTLNAVISASNKFKSLYLFHPSHIEWSCSARVNFTRSLRYLIKLIINQFRSFVPSNFYRFNPLGCLFYIKSAISIYTKYTCSNSSYVHAGHDITNVIVDSKLRFSPFPLYKKSFLDIYYIASYLQVYHKTSLNITSFNPKASIALYTCYSQHLAFINACLDSAIPVYFAFRGNSFLSPLKVSYPVHLTDFSFARKFLQTCSKSQLDELQTLSCNLLTSRKNGGNAGQSYMKKSAFTDKYLPTDLSESLASSVVVFLHDFYDSPHIYPGLDFTDFLDWSISTIRYLISTGKKVFVKAHPNEINPSKRISKLISSYFPQVTVIDSSYSNDSIFNASPALIITAYGNVALEAAYYGIQSISAIPFAPSFCSPNLLVSLDRSSYFSNIDKLLSSSTNSSRFEPDPISLGLSVVATYLDDGIDVAIFTELSQALNITRKEESDNPSNYFRYPYSPSLSYVFTHINTLLDRL